MKWDVTPESVTLETRGYRQNSVRYMVRVNEIRQGGYMWVIEGVGVSDISELKLTGSAIFQKRVVVEG